MSAVHTHDEAARIVYLLDTQLAAKGIAVDSHVPGIHGDTYDILLTAVEAKLIELANRVKAGEAVHSGEFSAEW